MRRAIILAKTNMSEFAWSGQHSLSSTVGRSNNPFDQSVSTSGSSGGTGAGVAAALGAGGLGTDSCGSILGPSAHQSLVGYRPTQDPPECPERAQVQDDSTGRIEHLGGSGCH